MKVSAWPALALAAALAGACGRPPATPPSPTPAPSPAPPSPTPVPKAAYVSELGELMIQAQVRHSKLWFAGEAGNWKLARYELDE